MKTGQWTLVGVNKSKQDMCEKHAAKHQMSVAAYLEYILEQDLKTRTSCSVTKPRASASGHQSCSIPEPQVSLQS